MSALEMVILLGFGVPIGVLSCAFVVLACRMQAREEERSAQRPLRRMPGEGYRGAHIQ
ncbi:MAG TPA: hypothetical protein IAC19_07660 [Candidatus Ventricola gallistercoris]|nr:hypothetical protein [Candidatus Ventricola gallistercoris]